MKKTIIAAALVTALTLTASAQKRFGVTVFSADFMRFQPDYESALENQVLMGTPVEILDSQGYWLKIRTPEPYTAWATDMGIVQMDSLQLADYIAAPKYICTATWAEVFNSPEKGAARISDLVAGDLLLTRYGDNGKPLKSNGFLGVALPSGKKGYVYSFNVSGFSAWASSRRATPDNVVRTALKFLGTPYMWGGTSSKGVDCSGLTRSAYFMNGVLLHRNASQQVMEGNEVDISGLKKRIAAVARTVADGGTDSIGSFGDLKKGDLLFFGRIADDGTEKITHVGMYIEDGRFIHSSHVVRINSLDASRADYYLGSTRLLRARRIVDEEGVPYTSGLISDSPYYFPQASGNDKK